MSKTKFPALGFRPKLSLQDQALFAKRLSLLLKAGAPLTQGIKMLERQAKSKANRKMYQHILHDISNGQYLAKSLKRFRNVFGDFAINIILIGETSGTLPENLRYLADEIDKRRKLRQKAMSALLYPTVIMGTAVAVSGLMTVYLFPKLLPIFKSLNADLPFTTRFLIFLSAFLLKDWWLVLIAVVVMVVMFAFLMRYKSFRFVIDKISLVIPIVGPLLKDYQIVNICRTMGTLFRSQVRLLEVVTITSETTTNLVYRKELEHLHRSLARGGNIATHLEKHPNLFPDIATQMIAIGESTGNLSDTLLYIAQIYEEELDEQTKRLSSVIEPAMMLMIGLVVGFIAVSVITPIYEVTQHLNPK